MTAKADHIRSWVAGKNSFIPICAECAEPIGNGNRCGCEDKDIMLVEAR